MISKHLAFAILAVLCLNLSACFEGQSLRKMKLENAILSQCDYIHEVLKNDFVLDKDGASYAEVCGKISGIITHQILENQLPERVKKFQSDTALLRSTIRSYMLKNKNEIVRNLK